MGDDTSPGSPGVGGPSSEGGPESTERTVVMTAVKIRRAIKRMAHEIIERNGDVDDTVIIGLEAGGVAPADALADALESIEGVRPPVGTIDVAFHRDDIGLHPIRAPKTTTAITLDLNAKIVILVDDVLYTGRTVRAALDALTDYGRPRSIQLAVLVDRGHRELPIRADYVGKNLPTSRAESVEVSLDGVAICQRGER